MHWRRPMKETLWRGGTAGRMFDSQIGAPAGIRIQKNSVASAQTNFACFVSIVCTDFFNVLCAFFSYSQKKKSSKTKQKKHKNKKTTWRVKKQKTIKNTLKKTLSHRHTPQCRQNGFIAHGFFLRKTQEEKKAEQ